MSKPKTVLEYLDTRYTTEQRSYLSDPPRLDAGLIVSWTVEIRLTKDDVANPKAKVKFYVSLKVATDGPQYTSWEYPYGTKTIRCTFDSELKILRTLDGWPFNKVPNINIVLDGIDKQIKEYFESI